MDGGGFRLMKYERSHSPVASATCRLVLAKEMLKSERSFALSVWEHFLQSNKLLVDVSVVQSLFARTQLSFSEVEITCAEFIRRSSRDVALSIFFLDLK